jgi:hypothetical protein
MQNRNQNKKWLKLISESYVQMNEMEEIEPIDPVPIDPSDFPYYEYYEPEYDRINPDDVRNDALGGLAGGLAYEAFANRFLRGRTLSPAVQGAIRGFLLGGAVSLSGFLAALLAAGLTIYAAYQIIALLAQAIDDYNGTSPARRIPPILPEHIRKVFPGEVPAPDPQITPSVLPPGNYPMLPGQQYPGQHPIGPNGLPYIPVSPPSGSYPPGWSIPMKVD